MMSGSGASDRQVSTWTAGSLGRWLAFAAVISIPCLLIVGPIGSFLLLSLFRAEGGAIIHEPGLTNYVAFFTNSTYWRTYLGTLWLCTQVVGFCLGIGYPVAWFIWRRRSRLRYLLLLLAVLPLFMSYIVKLYTLRSILGLNGLLNQALLATGVIGEPSTLFLYNQHAVLVTMTVVYFPFVMLPIFLSLERIPEEFIDASTDLGASLLSTIRHIVLPLSLPGAVAGGLFALVLTLGDFVTPQMVGGASGFTFGRVVWSQFGLAYNWPFGAALAAILLATALALIAIAGHVARRRAF
jgi:spermidine/putrescine transport system permease protein